MTDTPDSSNTYRYIPIAPLNSGIGEQATLNYSPSRSVSRQTLVDIAASTPIGQGTLSWSVHNEHIEEQSRGVSSPWNKYGAYHNWVWGNYQFRRHKQCWQVLHPTETLCKYKWIAHHFQGQLTDNNPDTCRQHSPGVCRPIGYVPYVVPPFTRGGPQDNYVVKLYQANSPWSRSTEVSTENTAGGNFYLPFAGGIGADTTTVYGSITSVTYNWIPSPNCGSGYQRVIWGYRNDPVQSKYVQGDCVPDSWL